MMWNTGGHYDVEMKGWMDGNKGGHYEVEMKGWMEKVAL